MPAIQANFACVQFDNSIVNGATCLQDLITEIKALTEVSNAFSVRGKEVSDVSTGALVQAEIKFLPNLPGYTKAQARSAVSLIVQNKAGARLCFDSICANQQESFDITSITTDIPDDWNTDLSPEGVAGTGTKVTTPRLEVYAGAYAEYDFGERTWSGGQTSPDSSTPGTGFSGPSSSPQSGYVEIWLVNRMMPVLDTFDEPASPQISIPAGSHITVGLSGGVTRVYTFKEDMEIRIWNSTNNAGGVPFTYGFWLQCYGDDEGNLWPYRLTGQSHGDLSNFDFRSGAYIRTRYIDDVRIQQDFFDESSSGGGLDYATACELPPL